jgi:group I intron endonuclease
MEKGSQMSSISVYKIYNYLAQKCYIGQTKYSPLARLHEHAAAAYKGKITPLCVAMVTNGFQAFTIETLGTYSTAKEALTAEIYFIRVFDSTNPESGYNQNGGGGGLLGMKHSDEWRANHSQKMKGEKHPRYGQKTSSETRAKISAAKTGKLVLKRRAVIDLPYVISHYRAGATLRELGEMFGVDRGVISRRLKEAGITLR